MSTSFSRQLLYIQSRPASEPIHLFSTLSNSRLYNEPELSFTLNTIQKFFLKSFSEKNDADDQECDCDWCESPGVCDSRWHMEITRYQASGNIGAAISKALVDSNKFNVSALSRQESTSTYERGIKVIKSDYSESSLIDAFKGQDAVVSALSRAGLGEETKIIDASVKAGVKRFIPSEFGSNTENANAISLIPVLDVKIQTNHHLKAQESKGLTWTAIATGPFFDWVSDPIDEKLLRGNFNHNIEITS